MDVCQNPECGKVFSRTKPFQKYCCESCKKRAKRIRERDNLRSIRESAPISDSEGTRICANPDCGKKFYPTNLQQRYCCPQCKWHTHDIAGRRRAAAYQKDKSERLHHDGWALNHDPFKDGLRCYGMGGIIVPMSTSTLPFGGAV